MNDCTCQLAPGLYRVASNGSIQHVTKVIVTREPMTPGEFILAAICLCAVVLIGALLLRSLNKNLLGRSNPASWGDYP
jgi:hypothetical protein